jgi:hypothetical protein
LLGEETVEFDGGDCSHRSSPYKELGDRILIPDEFYEFQNIPAFIIAERHVLACRVAAACEVEGAEMEGSFQYIGDVSKGCFRGGLHSNLEPLKLCR